MLFAINREIGMNSSIIKVGLIVLSVLLLQSCVFFPRSEDLAAATIPHCSGDACTPILIVTADI